MTREDKQLLLTDLCARLRYGVICEIDLKPYKLKGINKHKKLWWFEFDGFRCLDGVKPYLRPMSSMTEEEEIEYDAIFAKPWYNSFYIDNSLNGIDWLNTHHFDYRGLIEKGLAVEVTEENNPYKS